MKFTKLSSLLLSALLLIGCNQQVLPSVSSSMSQFVRQSASNNVFNFYSTALLKVPESVELSQALSALKHLQSRTLKESGNLAFIVHSVKEEPRTVLIWEQFKNESAFQEHLQSQHLQTFLKKGLVQFVQGHSASRPSTPVSNISKGFFSTAILTLINKQELARTLKAFKELEVKTRQESGNLTFVVQKIKGSQTFVIWEHFKNESAFQKHLNSVHLKQFLDLKLVKFEKAYSTQPLK